MAVLPERQGQGIGSQLVVAGLDVCRAAGYALVIVLGHLEFYPRFGFRPAPPLGIRWEHGADSHFMVMELQPGALAGAGGVVRYRPEFDSV
jgi:putative acetyltransferase